MKDVYAEANGIADEIMKRANENYAAQWPFLNEKEFEDVTRNVISIPDNSDCLTNCRQICCPTECCFYSDKLDCCGIYDFRSASCRFFFCEDSKSPTVLKKVHKVFCSEAATKYANDAAESEFYDKPSPLEKCFESAKSVKNNLKSDKMPPENAKNEWRSIILEYRNRKI